jgi:hypothetical protein
MALRLRDFTPVPHRAVRRSRNAIERRLANLPCPVPRDLVESLRTILFADRPLVDVVYGGGDGGPSTPYARSAGYRIVLYRRAFVATRAGGSRLAPVLFHELVHIARGWELDAEAFENAWFTRKEGARPPTREDWAIFKEQRYQGWWVRLDPRTRRVTDYADRLIHTFPGRPTRSAR